MLAYWSVSVGCCCKRLFKEHIVRSGATGRVKKPETNGCAPVGGRGWLSGFTLTRHGAGVCDKDTDSTKVRGVSGNKSNQHFKLHYRKPCLAAELNSTVAVIGRGT